MNTKQIDWLNEYCEKQGNEPFFYTNAGNIAYIYNELKKLEEQKPCTL